MNRISGFRRKHAHALILVAFAFGVAAVHAQAPTGPSHRPVGVPDGYVITPFGYFHASCVRQVAEGDTVLADEIAIQHADGTHENLQSCNHPRYNASGKLIASGMEENTAGVTPLQSTYIESASILLGNYINFGALVANWIVPTKPIGNDNQVLYFFPALTTTSNVQTGAGTILQPVLGWNSDFSGASPEWGIASWWCCVTGTVMESQPERAKPGDTIFGSVKSTCPAGTVACATWTVYTQDVTAGLPGTTLMISLPLTAQGYPQLTSGAYAGAVEEYRVVSCSDLPPNGSVTFTSIVLDDYNFNQIANPAWRYFLNPAMKVICSYDGSVAASQVTLDWSRQTSGAVVDILIP